MNIKNKIIKSLFIVLLIIPLNSCGIWDPADARKVDPSGEVRARKAIEEGRGISLDKSPLSIIMASAAKTIFSRLSSPF